VAASERVLKGVAEARAAEKAAMMTAARILIVGFKGFDGDEMCLELFDVDE
jgi:hypothetical protein